MIIKWHAHNLFMVYSSFTHYGWKSKILSIVPLTGEHGIILFLLFIYYLAVFPNNVIIRKYAPYICANDNICKMLFARKYNNYVAFDQYLSSLFFFIYRVICYLILMFFTNFQFPYTTALEYILAGQLRSQLKHWTLRHCIHEAPKKPNYGFMTGPVPEQFFGGKYMAINSWLFIYLINILKKHITEEI